MRWGSVKEAGTYSKAPSSVIAAGQRRNGGRSDRDSTAGPGVPLQITERTWIHMVLAALQKEDEFQAILPRD